MPSEFEEVYGQHLASVWRYVRARIPRHADAEDVTSEVFARAVRAWSRYGERRGPVAAWLLGIARHVVADWWRRQGREASWERIETRGTALAEPASEPEAAAVARAERDELQRHLEALTEKERDALSLRFGAGLKAAEVGAALDVSETAARMLVYRAVSKLRAVMAVE